MKDTCVLMTQIGKQKWQLIAPKGHVLVDDLVFLNAQDAAEWTRSYISSYVGWTFKLIIKENI